MKICPRCQTAYEDEAVFCASCGISLKDVFKNSQMEQQFDGDDTTITMEPGLNAEEESVERAEAVFREKTAAADMQNANEVPREESQSKKKQFTMFCSKCGASLPEKAVFCPWCGGPVPREAHAEWEQPEIFVQDTSLQPAPEAVKKKSSLSMILGSSLATIALIVLVFLGIKLLGGGNDAGGQKDIGTEMQVGDIITFGSYPQEANGTEKPIEWQVLAVEDGKALIISLYGLDERPYNEKYEVCTWETCTLRVWLNEEFYHTAFGASEQTKIQETLVVNKDNPTYGTPGGHDTRDKIFLLSLEETLKYFGLTKNSGKHDEYIYCYGDDVCCRPTDYALSQWTWMYKGNSSNRRDFRRYDDNAAAKWWMRSPGENGSHAVFVTTNGLVSSSGELVGPGDFVPFVGGICVRPALWINP